MSDSGSDDDMDWEEVVPFQLATHNIVVQSPSEGVPLQITIRAPPSKDKQIEAQARREEARAKSLQRFIRLQWANDELLHARLISITPLSLQTSFSMITPRQQPDRQLRGRQFEAALTRLVAWWTSRFLVDHQAGIKHQSFDEAAGKASRDEKGKAKATTPDDSEDDTYEEDRIRSAKSLMKHALMMEGSRDTSAQLFTALCRGLGLAVRLVVSIQSVLWRRDKRGPRDPVTNSTSRSGSRQQARKKEKDAQIEAAQATIIASAARNIGGSSQQYTSLSQTVERSGTGEADTEEILPSPSTNSGAKGKGRADLFPVESDTLRGSPSANGPASMASSKPLIRLRKGRPAGRRLGAPVRQHTITPEDSPPIFWVEVYSKPDCRWLPVDPIHNHVDKRKRFEPQPTDKFNHMLYVVAIEEDGCIRDVTRRYAKNFGTKILKERRTGMGKKDWWDSVVRFLTRPYRLQRDDIEDEEFEHAQELEGMPSSIGGFKDHPLYALGRHLHQDEVVHPLTQIGIFRGEPVYSRSNVTQVKTAENWMRTGRVVKDGEQPLKMSKIRAVTLQKQRAVEVIAEAQGTSGGTVQQGMYAQWQTKLFVPPPVVDGKVPKNDFGNVDLYVPSMLPAGGAHVPYKGTAKIARQLGIDYAEAVTGFEFKNRRAFPVLSGVVIPEERESELLEVYWELAQVTEEEEKQKKIERVLKHWTRLVQGLRIRQKLQDRYSHTGNHEAVESTTTEHPVSCTAHHHEGNFVRELDENITPYTLPKKFHITLESAAEGSRSSPGVRSSEHTSPNIVPVPETIPMVEDGLDASVLQVISDAPAVLDKETKAFGVPQSMSAFAAAELAEHTVRETSEQQGSTEQVKDAALSPEVDSESPMEEPRHVSPRRSTRQRQRVSHKVSSEDTSNRHRRNRMAPRSDQRALRSRSLRSSGR